MVDCEGQALNIGSSPLKRAMIGVPWWTISAAFGSTLTMVFLSIRLGFCFWQKFSQSLYVDRVERIFSVLVMGLLLKVL